MPSGGRRGRSPRAHDCVRDAGFHHHCEPDLGGGRVRGRVELPVQDGGRNLRQLGGPYGQPHHSSRRDRERPVRRQGLHLRAARAGSGRVERPVSREDGAPDVPHGLHGDPGQRRGLSRLGPDPHGYELAVHLQRHYLDCHYGQQRHHHQPYRPESHQRHRLHGGRARGELGRQRVGRDCCRHANRQPHPHAPREPERQGGAGQIALSWTAQGAANGWEYRQRTASTDYPSSWSAISGSGAATTGHTVPSLTPGTEYFFQVRATKTTPAYNGPPPPRPRSPQPRWPRKSRLRPRAWGRG